MKQLKLFIKRGTDLIPTEIKALKQHKRVLVVRTHPLTELAVSFYKQKKLLSWVVIFPWLIAATYVVFIQSSVYESSAKILIEKDDQRENLNLPGFMGSNNASSSELYQTREYILSREVLASVEKKLNIKDHFQSHHVDFLSRLKRKATQNIFLDYYHHKIKAIVDPETNEIIITASAFAPDMAEKILAEIIVQTKDFVNRVSNTLANKQYEFAKIKLQMAKEKLFQAGKDVIEWQNNNGVFDPKGTAQVVATVMGKLKESLVEKQTELINYSSFMQPNSNKVIALQDEINALKKQIERQTHVLLGKKSTNGKLNKIMSDFEWVQLKQTFSQAEYQAAQQAFDAASVNLAKTQNMVIVVESPNVPDEAISPMPLSDLTNILFVLLILFVLTKMSVIIIKEHID